MSTEPSVLGPATTRSLPTRPRQEAVIITADTDFGTLLVQHKTGEPSVVLVRELLSLPVAEQGRLLAGNLGQLREPLTHGAMIVIFSLTDIRIRPLPVD